jgi:hypothetical protein
MSFGVRRFAAKLLCGLLQRLLPPQLQSWGWAVRNEVAAISDDSDALQYAFTGLCGLAPRAIATQLNRLSFAIARAVPHFSGEMNMRSKLENILRSPRQTGIACVISAVMLGVCHMLIGDAPLSYMVVNIGALLIGLVALALFGRVATEMRQSQGIFTLLAAILLLATALFGVGAEGTRRWVDLGGLSMQPSLILLPAMIVSFARSSNLLSTIGLMIAATALALQPDRAMAGMLMAGLSMLAFVRRDNLTTMALMVSAIAFAATLAQAERLPAVPFVDQIFYTSFDLGLFAGLAVLGGAALLVVPAIIGDAHDRDQRATYFVFGIVWLTAIVAAALGNCPTPVVGYSGGAVLGYVLSLTLLPKPVRSELTKEEGSERSGAEANTQHRRMAYI